MYNLYKYRQDQAELETQKLQQQHYAHWLLKQQAIKSNALEKRKQRLNQFIEEHKNTDHVFQDDHYKIWRYNKQFRDVEDQTKFIGFKSFRHKPHYQVNKIFNERQRKQIANNSARAHSLVQQNKIPDQLRARSLRSQGPLNPKHTFRDKKADHQYLQPRMRYTNITDKQRFMEKSVTLDDKFKDVYKSFQMMKSSIGKANVKPNRQAQSLQKNKFDFIDEVESNMAESKPFFYQAQNPQQVDNPSASKILGQTTKLSFGQGQNKKRKTYFKLAKALAIEGHPDAKHLMVKTQYVRSKDLSNITKNISCEGYNKRPIL